MHKNLNYEKHPQAKIKSFFKRKNKHNKNTTLYTTNSNIPVLSSGDNNKTKKTKKVNSKFTPSLKLIKPTLNYLKTKKIIYLVFFIMLSVPIIASFLLFANKEVYGNYSWLLLFINIFCLVMATVYIFNVLFVQTKYNQLDLLLLSKSKTAKNIYLSKWITLIYFMNSFILINSVSLSIIFSIYSNNWIGFPATFFSSILTENIIVIFFTFMFTIFQVFMKGRIASLIVIILFTLGIFTSGISMKWFVNSGESNSINFHYKNDQKHKYANLFTRENDKIVKSVIEETNYSGKINNPSIYNKTQLDNFNPFNWLTSTQLLSISKQLTNKDVITNNIFNINSNRFTNVHNFFETKTNYDVVGIYPIGVKPLFQLSHKDIQDTYLNIYKSFIQDGYKEEGFSVIKGFVEKNDVWDDAPLKIKPILLKTIGVLGDINLLYWTRDKETLVKKVPDLFSFLKSNSSTGFAEMVESIFASETSLFNLKNIQAKNRNEFIYSKYLEKDKAPKIKDVDYFKKEFVQINNTQVQIKANKNNSMTLTLTEFKKEFNNISNQKDWEEYIDKNSFALSGLKTTLSKLENIYPKSAKYIFHENANNLYNFHYQYSNSTTTPFSLWAISLMGIFVIVVIATYININKIKTIDLKGF